MARSRNRLILAAVGTLILVAGVTSASAAAAQADSEALSVSVTVDPAGVELTGGQDAVTLTAVVANAPEGITPTYKWEERYSTGTKWHDLLQPQAVLKILEVPVNDTTILFRVTVSYGTEGTATSDEVSVTWTATPRPTDTPPPCVETATVSKPTGLTATVNPDGYDESGILVTWDLPDPAEHVYGYNLHRRKVVEGTATSWTWLGSLDRIQSYNSETGQYNPLPEHPPNESFDEATFPRWNNLVAGTTYAYAVVAKRWGSCGSAHSAWSDVATATYTAPVVGMSGDDEDDDEFVGGL